MADKKPDYNIERRKLKFDRLEHEQTIARGKARIDEISRQKDLNLLRVEIANAELDSEVNLIRTNESSLMRTIETIDEKLALMVKADEITN